tara:strand:- start:1821 stop:3860 length:2040 start_codon:yes stop_codon:yes gene_type:complete
MINFLKYLPFQLTLFLIVGIVIGYYFSFNPLYLFEAGLFLIIIFSIVYFFTNRTHVYNWVYTVVVLYIALFIGVSSITLKREINSDSHYSNSLDFKTNENRLGILSIRKVLKSTNYFNKYEAEVLQINSEGLTGKILINLRRDSTNYMLKVDDEIIVNSSILELSNSLNPYSFNYKKYLQNQQIFHQIYVENEQFLKIPVTNKSVIGFAAKFREQVNNSLKKFGFKNDELAVINALLLGQRQDVSSELLESYSGAGAIHILAVSGLHIGVFLLILTILFRPLQQIKNGKIIAGFLIICLLWSYAIIAGLSASVVRAVAMFTAITIGLYSNRPSNVYSALIISMFFLLLFNPNYLFEVGFQLSYLAVFAIVWIQPKLYNLVTPKLWIVNKIWQLLTVSIAAQIGVLPLSIFYFHQFPGLFFASNLIVIPFLGFILTFGIIIISLALANLLPLFLADSFIVIIRQMNHFISWIANQHYFIIKDISLSIFLMVAIYLFIFLFLKWTERKCYYRVIIVFVSLISLQSILIFEKYSRHSTNEFIVFNDNRSSLITKRIGANISVYSSMDSLNNNYAIKSYLLGTGLKKFKVENFKNLYSFNNETILVIDSLGIYDFTTIKATIVVLQHSPKINLNRLLKTHQPKMLIVNGTNYKSYLENWERTCFKNKTPFYNTMQKGAFILTE